MNNEKKISGFSLFTLWFGAAVSLAEIMTGGLIAPLGIKNGITVIVIGHMIGCIILALVGTIGFREKKPSLMASRISLGKHGSYIISIFNIIQLIGWTAIMLIQCARSIQPIVGGFVGDNSFSLLVILAGILVALWALNADKGISTFNNIAVILLAALSFLMLTFALRGGQAQSITEMISFGTALELSIVMPLSWVPLISDYTMSGKSEKGSILGSFLGYFIGSTLMYIIGLVTAVYSGTSDIIGMLFKFNMGFAALFIVIFATVTTTFMDVYSAVLTTLNLSQVISSKKLIIAFTALGTLLAIYFPMEHYENFLYMIGSFFAPAFSIIIIDYFIYKKDRSKSKFNIPGIVSILFGTASYYIVSGYDLILGSSIPTILTTATFYIILRSIVNKLKLGES